MKWLEKVSKKNWGISRKLPETYGKLGKTAEKTVDKPKIDAYTKENLTR